MKLKGNWRRMSGAVYQSKDGSRVHMLGVIKDVNNNIIHTESGKYSKSFYHCLKVCGHNRKRALMFFAENCINQLT